jgi:hypothetical protein
MLRSVLTSGLLLTILGACGGSKGTAPKVPQVSIPGPTAWDGKGPSPGSVTFISTLPGDASKFVAYEVDPGSCRVSRTIVDELDALQKLIVVGITDPMDNAGTAQIIRTPPPPPPDGQGLLFEALRITGHPPGQPVRCDPPPLEEVSPTHQ